MRSKDINKDLPAPRGLDQEEENIPRAHPVLWVGLSAAASILLLSTTSHLTQEVAPIPLLWVLPLGIYLLSFVLSFSGEGFYSRPLFTLLLTISSAGVIYDLMGSRLHFLLQIMIYSILPVFSLHGRPGRTLQPSAEIQPDYQNSISLISIGGALGGLFVNLIAPLIFNGYWEFYLGWVLIYLLLDGGELSSTLPWKSKRPGGKVYDRAVVLLTMTFLVFSLYRIINPSANLLYQDRNFYGVSKVVYSEYRDAYQYINGKTMHGFQ